MTVREAVFAFMRDNGMTTVFGNPGSTELRFLRDWPHDFRYVTALHEGCAVAMADAYAQVRRNAAFVNLHSAGGLGNAMGCVFSAFKNQTPLVITAGQQSRAMLPARPFLYAQDAVALPAPYVKWSCEPARAADVPEAIAQAYRMASQPPFGPAFVSIPEDDWDRDATPVAARRIDARFRASRAAVDDIARAFAECARPALVVGPGVDRDDACDAVVRLAERTGAAVYVAPFSSRCSFPERHDRFAGFLPPVRTGIVDALAAFDLVVVLGAPVFTYHVFAEGPAIASGTRLIQVTDDAVTAASAIDGTSVVATLRETVDDVVARIPNVARGARPVARAATRDLPDATPLSGAYVLQTVARTMPPDAIVVEEAPSHRAAMHDRLPIERPGGFFAAASGSLGWGLPAAAGAALATSRRVVAILGDGSALYAIQGLWTAAHLRLPITYVVLNNRAYAAMDQFGRYLGLANMPSFALAGVDFVRAAESFGVSARRADDPAGLHAALTASFASDGPTLVDAHVDDAVAPIY